MGELAALPTRPFGVVVALSLVLWLFVDDLIKVNLLRRNGDASVCDSVANPRCDPPADAGSLRR